MSRPMTVMTTSSSITVNPRPLQRIRTCYGELQLCRLPVSFVFS